MNPIIKILRGTTPPPTLEAGRIAIDQAAKNLYVGISDGAGGTINEIVGGSGTFATKSYVTSAVSGVSGTLGDMASQNKNAVDITGGSVNGTAIGGTAASSGAFTTLSASNTPVSANDVVRKTDLTSAISALGSVFHFVGDASAAATPLDLSTLSDQTTGAYYRVDVAGTYIAGGFSAKAKVSDAFVKTTTGWQKLDNVDVVVSGTANEIAVSGDENDGYSVALAPEFKTLVDGKLAKASNLSDLADASLSRTNLGLGSIATQNSNSVAVTGGSINGTAIGATTASTGAFTSISASGNLVGNGTSQITDFIIDGGVY